MLRVAGRRGARNGEGAIPGGGMLLKFGQEARGHVVVRCEIYVTLFQLVSVPVPPAMLASAVPDINQCTQLRPVQSHITLV